MDSSKVLSCVQLTKKIDKSILTADFEEKTSKRITIGDIGNILMTHMKIRKEQVLGIQKYYIGPTMGFVKIKMDRPIDVKTRFTSDGGKCEDDRVSITILGVVVTNEKIRILDVNELASANEVLSNLQTAWVIKTMAI